MTVRRWRVLIVEDDPKLADAAEREVLDGFATDGANTVQVVKTADFSVGMAHMESGQCDVAILDVRRDGMGGAQVDTGAGRDVFDSVKERRFIPVIFWTALPESVRDCELKPFVQVLPKDEIERIPNCIREVIASGVIEAMSDIERNVGETVRQHLWSELAPNWADYTTGEEPIDVAGILIGRVARALDARRGWDRKAHSSHRYLYPPVASEIGMGDILFGPKSKGAWLVVLTPTCDFAQKKADHVLVAQADLLVDSEAHRKWLASKTLKAPDGSNRAKGELQDLMKATSGRYAFLPSFRSVPNLVVDFQQAHAIPLSSVEHYTRIASLLSPHSEALTSQFSQYFGRIGAPDLDVARVFGNLP